MIWQRKRWGLLLVVLLAALPSLGHAQNPNEILKRLIEAEHRNWERASQYTYVEETDIFSFDKQARPRKSRSETHDIIFIEGGSYKKLVARNEQPLGAKEQAREDKKLQQVAAERKQKHSGLLHKVVNIGSNADLLTLFDSRLVGEEDLRGHKVWVISCVPKAGRIAANAHEKEVLSFQRKFWIDQAEDQLVKSVYTVVGQHIVFMPGTELTWEFAKINDDAWLPVSGVIDGHLQFAKLIKPAVRTEYRNTRFQKFDVQSTITSEPVK